jgi:drug/metabolite transporter (DMT)-like permease
MLLFGVLFLKEKFNKIEAMSALIIIFGVFIVSFSTGNYVFKGVLLLVVGSISYASSKYLIKSKLQKISPLFLSHYRVSVAAVYILSFALLSGQFQPYISKGLLFTTLPAIFSAVFGHILMYKAYKLIEISKIELIFASQPFLVSIASYIVFREVLTLQQFLGGFLIVGGIIWLIYAKNHININIKLNFIKNKFMLSKTGKK